MILRCHSCSRLIARVEGPMELVALFKPSAVSRVWAKRSGSKKCDCQHCGWVNVFQPERSGEMIEVKSERIGNTDPLSKSAPGPFKAVLHTTPRS